MQIKETTFSHFKGHSTYDIDPYKNTFCQIRKQKTAVASLSPPLSAHAYRSALTVQPWQRAVVL